ncbi:hypothetical protein DOTSEDRAFT_79829 [Dothistroma septosporum NZE10]|uniref:Uncharacterized protein n=1 Tax=Dothistroma septosporum (strain NZE10 / CBS 128990) TaxID=675120 RepID=N1PK49_DOTSN|nr:hypothetical protein DOTSEDRAFT_79829 [Dothistroma septosporum NZE10]
MSRPTSSSLPVMHRQSMSRLLSHSSHFQYPPASSPWLEGPRISPSRCAQNTQRSDFSHRSALHKQDRLRRPLSKATEAIIDRTEKTLSQNDRILEDRHHRATARLRRAINTVQEQTVTPSEDDYRIKALKADLTYVQASEHWRLVCRKYLNDGKRLFGGANHDNLNAVGNDRRTLELALQSAVEMYEATKELRTANWAMLKPTMLAPMFMMKPWKRALRFLLILAKTPVLGVGVTLTGGSARIARELLYEATGVKPVSSPEELRTMQRLAERMQSQSSLGHATKAYLDAELTRLQARIRYDAAHVAFDHADTMKMLLHGARASWSPQKLDRAVKCNEELYEASEAWFRADWASLMPTLLAPLEEAVDDLLGNNVSTSAVDVPHEAYGSRFPEMILAALNIVNIKLLFSASDGTRDIS